MVILLFCISLLFTLLIIRIYEINVFDDDTNDNLVIDQPPNKIKSFKTMAESPPTLEVKSKMVKE